MSLAKGVNVCRAADKNRGGNSAPVTVRDWRFIAARSPCSPCFCPLFAPKPPLFVIAYPARSLPFSTRTQAAMHTAPQALLLPGPRHV